MLALLLAAVPSAGDASSSLLFSTEWRWNDWRSVKFHSPRHGQAYAKFWAPTADCESGLCSWWANSSGVYVQWGDAGLHELAFDGPHSLNGVRLLDGSLCSATYVGQFEEELFDLDLYAMV